MELYDYQKEAIRLYDGSGIVHAVTGSGKSLIGVKIGENLGGHILVASHRKPILNQWRLKFSHLEDVEFATFNKLSKEEYPKKVKLLIVDEVDRSVSPEFIKLYNNVDYENILGLSATPTEKAIEMCGDVFIKVDWQEANVSPFIVEFHGIDLNHSESYDYQKLTRQIKNLKDDDIELTAEQRKKIEAMIFKRRGLVYKAENRIPKAISLITTEHLKGKKIMVFCQRIEQANEVQRCLNDNDYIGIDSIVYHSQSKGGYEAYTSGKVKVLISVGMLNYGFDDIETDCAVIVSTFTTETFNTQTIGRVVRTDPNAPDKIAKVHIILANKTTDMSVMRFKDNYDFTVNDSIIMPLLSPNKRPYYAGKKFSFLGNDIWYKTKGGRRQYMESHPIVRELREYKFKGGSFTISQDGVFTRVGDKIIKVTEVIPDLVEDENRGPRDLSKPLSDDEKEEMHDFLKGFEK